MEKQFVTYEIALKLKEFALQKALTFVPEKFNKI